MILVKTCKYKGLSVTPSSLPYSISQHSERYTENYTTLIKSWKRKRKHLRDMEIEYDFEEFKAKDFSSNTSVDG
uniref:Uncharacterized protein n=1 Tax=Octopus bimaculoides TaxID=37653 RepID=A0A0L8HJS5_OCTBM